MESEQTHRALNDAPLEQLQKLETLAQLAAGVVHDFNNLLAIIIASAESLRLKPVADEGAKQCVDDILAAAFRAVTLTRQVLHWGARGAGPRETDLNEVLANLSGLIERMLGKGVDFSIELAPAPTTVDVSCTHLEQIVLNLAANARDAMSDGGHLRIATSTHVCDEGIGATRTAGKNHVLLTVSDTGCGMDEATKTRMFELFFTTKAGRGTGIGLATVHQLVTACGGCIRVESAPDAGTTFRVCLPMAEPHEAAVGHPARANG